MHTEPKRASDQTPDTVPEFPAVVDSAGSDFAKIARRVRHRRAVRRTGEALAEFAKESPEMVLELIQGLWP